jgi:integrase
MKELHIVPLSKQAIAVLRELEKLSGDRQYVFPNHRNPTTFMRGAVAPCPEKHRENANSAVGDVYNSVSWH